MNNSLRPRLTLLKIMTMRIHSDEMILSEVKYNTRLIMILVLHCLTIRDGRMKIIDSAAVGKVRINSQRTL